MLRVVILLAIDENFRATFLADPEAFGVNEQLDPDQVTLLTDRVFNPVENALVNVQTIPLPKQP